MLCVSGLFLLGELAIWRSGDIPKRDDTELVLTEASVASVEKRDARAASSELDIW